MNYKKRWCEIDECGQGGQGKVFKVIDYIKFGTPERQIGELINLYNHLFRDRVDNFEDLYNEYRKLIFNILKMENPNNHCAIKVLHKSIDRTSNEKAKKRLKREIEAMQEINHTNLISIIDYDTDDFEWYVMPYYPKSTLEKNIGIFKGDILKTLKSFRPLVEAVAQIHKAGCVHRDIKPQNIFLSDDGRLVLGDFGIIFFSDPGRTRVSDTYENVGSRDWMPGWAQGCLIEEIKPTFDVFCLGKVLWAMITGKTFMRLWYCDQPDFNVERILEGKPTVSLLNPFFKKCITEHEKDCIGDANKLLDELNELIDAVSINGERLYNNIFRKCNVCGKGKYFHIADQNRAAITNFGLNPAGARSFKILACDYCGHVQLFTMEGNIVEKAWKNS